MESVGYACTGKLSIRQYLSDRIVVGYSHDGRTCVQVIHMSSYLRILPVLAISCAISPLDSCLDLILLSLLEADLVWSNLIDTWIQTEVIVHLGCLTSVIASVLSSSLISMIHILSWRHVPIV